MTVQRNAVRRNTGKGKPRKNVPLIFLFVGLAAFIGFLFLINSMQRDLDHYMIEQGLSETPGSDAGSAQQGEEAKQKTEKSKTDEAGFRKDKAYLM